MIRRETDLSNYVTNFGVKQITSLMGHEIFALQIYGEKNKNFNIIFENQILKLSAAVFITMRVY